MRLRSGGGRTPRPAAGIPGPGRAPLMSRRRLFLPLLLGVCLAVTWIASSHVTRERQSWELSSLAGDGLDPTPWHTSQLPPRSVLQWLKRRQQLMMCTGLCTSGSTGGPPAAGSADAGVEAEEKASPAGAAPAGGACPDFFQWIYDDLAPWKETGIREDHVVAAKEFAAFRVVILNGDLYVDMYYRCVQSRGFFTLWGLVQLLERFPGQVPDVDFMFDCMDRPHFEKASFRGHGSRAAADSTVPDQGSSRHHGAVSTGDAAVLPPLFRYCSTSKHLDIPFPDWSFWGWPEVRLRPWHNQSSTILRGSEHLQWTDREDWAYWRGNPNVGSPAREQLMRCNQSPDNSASKARIVRQDWSSADGARTSDVAEHCRYKYMVYAEGHAWSASYKYIMACGSPVLAVASAYYEFFTRGLLPMHHYVPVRAGEEMCGSIDALVTAGNAQPKDMKEIGDRGQRFMLTDLAMDNVYSYMLHLLTEYSKLMRYRPAVPPRAERVCRSKILCLATEEQLPFLLDTEIDAGNTRGGALVRPCSLPPYNRGDHLHMDVSRQAGLDVALKMEQKVRKRTHQ